METEQIQINHNQTIVETQNLDFNKDYDILQGYNQHQTHQQETLQNKSQRVKNNHYDMSESETSQKSILNVQTLFEKSTSLWQDKQFLYSPIAKQINTHFNFEQFQSYGKKLEKKNIPQNDTQNPYAFQEKLQESHLQFFTTNDSLSKRKIEKIKFDDSLFKNSEIINFQNISTIFPKEENEKEQEEEDEEEDIFFNNNVNFEQLKVLNETPYKTQDQSVKPSYQCKYCSRVFHKSKKQLGGHIRKAHSNITNMQKQKIYQLANIRNRKSNELQISKSIKKE